MQEVDGGQAALLDQLKLALPSLPGFRSLSLFGSIAEGRADAWSDIDMIVTTDDLPRAKSSVLGLLEECIGPVEFCWAINLRPDEWNPMIVFREHGYYRRLELGLAATNAVNRTIPPEQTVLLIDTPGVATAPRQSGAYVPESGSIGHFLLSQYIGGIRYCKARHRAQPITCYRFAAAAADWCARALYDRLTGKPSLDRKLSTSEYIELDRLASPEHKSALLADVDFSNPSAMDRAIYALLCRITDHAQSLASSAGEQLPDAVIERFLHFVRDEVEVGAD